ncbi:hypothetical protein OROGR_032737 [Orobanche gracilis]
MADEVNYYPHQTKFDEPCEGLAAAATHKAEECAVEASDRGLFDFVGKKEEEKKFDLEEDVIIVTDCEEKPEVFEVPKEEVKKHEGLFEKLHRSDSSSSSSSDEEEVDENGEKKKKKKGLKEKIKEKFSGEKKDEEEEKQAAIKCEEDIVVPVEKCDIDDEDNEKKGFLDKIKEKLPGGKKIEEVAIATPPPPPPSEECAAAAAAAPETESKEKKGFLEKIKEKLPGHHSKNHEEKEKEKKEEEEGACY